MSKLRVLWGICIPLAIAACTAQYQLTRPTTLYEQACAAVEEEFEIETCDFPQAEIIRGSLLVELLGAYGIYVHNEVRIYLASPEFISMGGITEEIVEFHETIHHILKVGDVWEKGMETERCWSEDMARKLTDAKYGTKSRDNWRGQYGCTSPDQMI